MTPNEVQRNKKKISDFESEFHIHSVNSFLLTKPSSSAMVVALYSNIWCLSYIRLREKILLLINMFPDSKRSKYFPAYLLLVKLICLRCGINLINLIYWTGVFMTFLENHAIFDLSHRCHTTRNIHIFKSL